MNDQPDLWICLIAGVFISYSSFPNGGRGEGDPFRLMYSLIEFQNSGVFILSYLPVQLFLKVEIQRIPLHNYLKLSLFILTFYITDFFSNKNISISKGRRTQKCFFSGRITKVP